MLDLANAIADQPRAELKLWGPPGPIPNRAVYVASTREAEWLKSLLREGGMAHLLRNRPLRATATAIRLLAMLRRVFRREQNIDVAHVAWLQNALALHGTRVPALISVLGSDFKLLRIPGMVRLLRAVLRQRRAVIAPNSEWMVPRLQKYFGDIARIQYIPFGIDKRFLSLRRAIEVHQPRRWLVVLRLTQKKIGPLFQWGADIFGEDDQLHLFGPNQENIKIPGWVRYHGPTNPDTLSNEWFPQAAGVISLSAHDEGRPQVLLEAMAAGLPVIATPLPAHRDIIQHGKTGWLVDSQAALRAALEALREPSTNIALGTHAHDWVRQHIGTWDDCARRHLDQYRNI